MSRCAHQLWRETLMWVIARSHPSFKAAEAQLYHIRHLSEATASLSRSRYLTKAEQLRREGYTQPAIDSVPMPPPDVPALHWANDCKGELRKGSLKTDVMPGWTVPYCPRCGWVQQTGVHALQRRQVEDLQDQGPLLLPPNPDAFAVYEDPEGEGPSVASQQREQANAYRSLKAAGALVPADHISTLPHAPALATLEKMIARGQVRSWPDPDTPARRLLLAFEFA